MIRLSKPHQKRQHVFKAILTSLLFFTFQSPLFSQAIEAGVYNTADGSHPISINYDESGNLIYEDFRGVSKFKMESKTKYVYLTQTLSLVGPDKIIHADVNGYKKEFSLFSPKYAKPVEGVIKFAVGNNTFFARQTKDPKFVGLYKYEGRESTLFSYPAGAYLEGSPIVNLKDDHTGDYQNHGSAIEPVEWWIESDYKGSISEIDGVLARRYNLVVKFLTGNRQAGKFSRMQLDVYKDGSKAVILGERVKELHGSVMSSTREDTGSENSSSGTGGVVSESSAQRAANNSAEYSGLPTSTAVLDYKELAKIYQAKMKSDPARAKIYSFCAAAAMAKSTLSEEAFMVYVKRISASLKTLVEENVPCPCGEIIPAKVWE